MQEVAELRNVIEQIGIVRVLVIIAAVLSVLVAVQVYMSMLRSPATTSSQIRVAEFSLDRSVIDVGENSTLTVVVENIDLKTHQVEYRFNASHRVLVYAGNEEVLPRIDSCYTFDYILGPVDPSTTKVFTISGTLEEGAWKATYPIFLIVYVDGEELEKTWNDLTLTVEK